MLGDCPGTGRAVGLSGWVARSLGDAATARAHFEESLALARDSGDARALAYALVWAAYFAGPYDDAARGRMAAEALAQARALGDPLATAMAHRALGDVALRRGEYARARAAFTADLALTRSLKDTVGVVGTLNQLGDIAMREGDSGAAEARYREALALARAAGVPQAAIADTLARLGEARPRGGTLAWRARLGEALAAYEAAANQGRVAAVLERLAALDVDAHPERAVRLAGAAAAHRAPVGLALGAQTAGQPSRDVEVARRTLGADAFASAWAAGQAMSLEQAVADALEDPPDAAASPGLPGWAP